jgi:hypothetical protein
MAHLPVNKKVIVDWGNQAFKAFRRARFSPPIDVGGAVMAYVFCVTARRNGYSLEKVLDLVKAVWELAGEVEVRRIQEG